MTYCLGDFRPRLTDELNYAKTYQDRDIAIPWELLDYLESGNKLWLVKGEEELLSGVQILETPGHTSGHISTGFSIDSSRYVFSGDAKTISPPIR